MFETTTVGKFKNQTTGATYTVIKNCEISTFTPIGGAVVKSKGAPDYKTSCGIELNSRSDDESKFETLDNEILLRIG